MNIFPFLSINHSCDDAFQWAQVQLKRAGLHPVPTFNLHTARTGLKDCPCPTRGTDDRDCQMVILLVYGNSGKPETLVLHGSGEKTWLSISDTFASYSNGLLAELIKKTLMNQEPFSAGIHK